MRVTESRVGASLDRPDPAVRLFLFSGNDGSTSRLHAQRLLKAQGSEKINFTGLQLKSDPGLLVDEAASISLFGGRRLIWVEPAGEDMVPALDALLALPSVEACTVAIAGALKKDSILARLADASSFVWHVVSEPLSLRDQAAGVMELGRAEGLHLSPQLAERIAEEAAGNLILARLELQKFAIYCEASPEHPRELDEAVVDALGIDQAETDHSRPGDLALAGDIQSLGAELSLLETSGIDPIPVVRSLQRRLLMLAPLRARIEAGQPPDLVLRSVWRDRVVAARTLTRWSSSRLSEVFARVQRLEKELLLQPLPGHATLGETLLQIARAAQR